MQEQQQQPQPQQQPQQQDAGQKYKCRQLLPRTRPLSICIPRIESTVAREYIYHTFSKLNIGYIDKISEIPLRNDSTHKRVIIKIHWNSTATSQFIQGRLNNEESVKIVHSTTLPWYWKLVKSN